MLKCMTILGNKHSRFFWTKMFWTIYQSQKLENIKPNFENGSKYGIQLPCALFKYVSF